MDRNVGIALLVVGIVLIVFGLSSAESLSSDISNFFTGSPTNKAIWLLIAGIVLTVVGAASLRKKS